MLNEMMSEYVLFSVFCATVSRALRETTYPFLALICLRENRMNVVGRMEGKLSLRLANP